MSVGFSRSKGPPATFCAVICLPRLASRGSPVRRVEGREDGGQADVFRYRLLMATIRRAAPIFPVRNLSASLTQYRRLGFDTSDYEGGGYGFVTRDGIEIHLEVVPYINPKGAQHVAYLWVDDADAFAQAWLATRSRTPNARRHGMEPT
jgi:hypothetical protein